MSLLELADELKKYKTKLKEIEEEERKVKKIIEDIESQMVNAMVEEEVQNFSMGGTLFYLNTKSYSSPVPERKQELFKALKDQGYGDLVYETVNSNSLSAFVREQMEENGDELPEWLQGLVNIYDKTSIGMRKAAK